MAVELDIEITPSGQVTVRPRGIKGKDCIHFAELMAQIVGREESRQYTSEYHETENRERATQKLHQQR